VGEQTIGMSNTNILFSYCLGLYDNGYEMHGNPLYEKFGENGLSFAHQPTTLFKDVVTNGEFIWAPSSGILPNVD
jgi:hypothetical protein